VNVVAQHFFNNKFEVRRFCTITISIISLIIVLFNGILEKSLGIFNMLTNLWKIGYFEGRAILLDNVHQRNIIEQKFIIMVDVKFQRWEFNRLVNQVNVVFHPKLKSINGGKVISYWLLVIS
jgi:hypothetical protein